MARQLEQVSDMLRILQDNIVVSDNRKGSTASLSKVEDNNDNPFQDWENLYYNYWFSKDSV